MTLVHPRADVNGCLRFALLVRLLAPFLAVLVCGTCTAYDGPSSIEMRVLASGEYELQGSRVASSQLESDLKRLVAASSSPNLRMTVDYKAKFQVTTFAIDAALAAGISKSNLKIVVREE